MKKQEDLVWNKVLDLIKAELNIPTFKTWFENTRPVSVGNSTLIVSVPNQFAKEWLESRYLSLINNSIKRVMNDSCSVEIVVDKNSLVDSNSKPNKKIPFFSKFSKPKIKKYGDLYPKYTFETFVIGESNRFAHAAALAVAESPAKSYNPLFIYGGVGLGKTHLLNAIGHYLRSQYPNILVKYVTSEKFLNEFINSIRDDKANLFQKKYRNNDVLLIDDIQFLGDKTRTQIEFFHTFNDLYNSNKQIVISSDRPPKDIPELEERLISRFEWGLITDIQPPALETRIAILRKFSMREGYQIPDGVMEYIADRIKSNIRELEGALIRVAAYASLNRIPIDINLSEEVLKDIFPENSSHIITINTIQKEACKYFSIPLKRFISKERTKEIALPRQIAMYLCRELTDSSLPKIGKSFGNRDHTTVLYAFSKISELLNHDRDIYNQVKEITNRIKKL